MKSNFWLLGGSLWLATASVWAQDNARDNATTNGPRRIAGVAKSVVMETPAAGKVVNLESLNVRSEPNFTSDILTHLHRGQMVLVFEQLTLSKPKPNEPTNWARIGLPTNAPVWVAAQYVDTNTMTVSARRVNVRGGPSDNYTIVCRLEKGAPVQEVARRPDWIQIVPPTNAFGYVAAEYLNVEPATAPPATPAPAENAGVAVAAAPAPPPAAPTNPVAEAAVAAPATNATAVVSAAPDASTTNAAPTNPVAAAEPTAQIVAPDPVAAAPAPAPTTPTNTITPAATAEPAGTKPAAAAAEASPPVGAATDAASTETKLRVVTREGYIRRTYNIQAPTDFVLHEAESGEITEYIQPDPKDKTFKKYVGTRVLVTGSEWLDRRWPTRPILKVENIELLP